MRKVLMPFVASPELKRLERKLDECVSIYNNGMNQSFNNHSTTAQLMALIALDNAREEYLILRWKEEDVWMNSVM
jgi:hypothetical protein